MPPRIGNFKLERPIGKGGTSEVWLGTHRTLSNRLVAIKVLLSQDSEWVERFKREANITSRLRHDHIVQIYDHGYQPPYHYTVMEYAAGGSLRDLLKQNQRLLFQQALHILRYAGSALDYAHTQGVIHRDVSPGNILLQHPTNTADFSKDRVLLTDFGIARTPNVGTVTTINKVMGTPGYMSPEHAISATAVIPASDVYSLGVVFFEMLTGRLPWDQKPAMPDTGAAFLPPKSLRECGIEGLPPEVDRVLMTMLALDPNKRYPKIADAVAELEDAFDRHSSSTQVVSIPASAASKEVHSSPQRIKEGKVETHLVEKVLGPDLFKGPFQESRKRAADLRNPAIVADLLNQWSGASRWGLRRPLLGRQAFIHESVSHNLYFYKLTVMYESRRGVKSKLAPDYKNEQVKIEKKVGLWEVGIPRPKDFSDENEGDMRLPGTTHKVSCTACQSVGRIACTTCKGTGTVVRRDTNRPAAPTPDPKPAPTTTTTTTTTARPAPSRDIRVLCTDCNGAGQIQCKSCDGVGNLIEHENIVWSRRASSFSSHDDLGKIDESWLKEHCKPKNVYVEQHEGGFSPAWSRIPELGSILDEAKAGTDEHTRIVLSKLEIDFIPITDIRFDIGKQNDTAEGKSLETYDWQIVGFEQALPVNWQFLNWDRIVAGLGLATAVVVFLLLMVLLTRL